MPRSLSALCLLVVGCSAIGAAYVTPDVRNFQAEVRGPCPAVPQAVGQVLDVRLDEISGLAESHHTPGVFFVHNDSSDSARFFALDRAGQVLAELVLETVPTLIDAEDIALGPGPGGESFVYLGDTGNNFASSGLGIPRRKAVIYRIPEPRVPLSARGSKLSLREVFPIVLTFPDGAQNVEAFFVDPTSGQLVMIGRQSDGHSQVLSAGAELLAAGGGELRLVGELRFGHAPLAGSPTPTAASISRDGSAILIRTYTSVFLFRRHAGESVMRAFGRAPSVLPSPAEQQGEAIGFTESDSSFLTISEGPEPAVHCARITPP
jgi:hypothetical protein